jgi:hypothetical protein
MTDIRSINTSSYFSFHIEGLFAYDLSKLYFTNFAVNHKLIEMRIS